MNKEYELRMYSLVMYNLSPIQKGIQAYHATIEATRNFGNSNSIAPKKFIKWADKFKTVIILDGGTSSDIERHMDNLWNNKIRLSYFRERDLNNSMSAISFIVDERVFDKKKYPDFGEVFKYEGDIDGQSEDYLSWVNIIGGEKNVFLRDFLEQFDLAR